jgi:hypothetical protein
MSAFSGLNDSLLHEFGETITYTTAGHPSVNISAIVKTGGEYGTPIGQIAGEVYVRATDLPIGAPLKLDVMVVRSVNVRVQELLETVEKGTDYAAYRLAFRNI